jgi:hypothetical protein
MNIVYLDIMVKHYLVCALWTSENDNASIEDIDINSRMKSISDCAKFISLISFEFIDSHYLSAKQLGHDFWLTRNHHGAGFWDRNYSEDVEKKLMDAVRLFNEVDVIRGDDSKIYLEP